MEGGATNAMTEIITALTAGFQGAATNITSVLTAIVPIALGIFAMVWVVRKATSFFKGLTK